MIDIDDHRRFEEIAARELLWALAATQDFRSHLAHTIEFLLNLFPLHGANHRTQVNIGTHWIADPKRAGKLDELVDELRRDRIENIKALARSADLAHVQIRRPHGAAHGHVQIDVVTDNKRIVPAQFELDLFQTLD